MMYRLMHTAIRGEMYDFDYMHASISIKMCIEDVSSAACSWRLSYGSAAALLYKQLNKLSAQFRYS
jgi:hypothetical protein